MTGLAILCPGQGGQHAGMLDFATASPDGADALRRCAGALGWDPVARARAAGSELFSNAIAQPLVCAAELATWAAVRPALPPPRLFLGYSLGELAAHGCAGALAPEEAARLAVRRAALMDTASPPGAGLVALRGIALPRAEALAAEAGAEIAIANGPDHVVVGGVSAALAEVERRAARAGATTIQRLPVGVPAHTRLLEAAVAPFADALAQAPVTDPAIPVLAGTSGLPVRTRAEVISALSLQIARRIEWSRCLAAAAEMGCTVFLELGPGGALTRMAAEVVPAACGRSVADFRTVAGIARWVEGALASR
ncbi:MAG TPA: acyltransferase domain-containing protein [Anaeromyxobacter sp.]